MAYKSFFAEPTHKKGLEIAGDAGMINYIYMDLKHATEKLSNLNLPPLDVSPSTPSSPLCGDQIPFKRIACLSNVMREPKDLNLA